MNSKSIKPLAFAVTAALAASMGTVTVNAAENPFMATSLSSGYMTHAAAFEGKCGEGKCGGDKAEGEADKGAEGKCGEGKCGGSI